MKLVLFDIDGTLMDSGGAGVRSLSLAFHDVFGVEDAFAGVPMAGRTDTAIVMDALARHGFPSDNGIVPRLIEGYVQHLGKEIKMSLVSEKPGVRKLLDRLAAAPDAALGLLTGNIEQGAYLKLGSLGLEKYFAFGAFGGDHQDRNRLLPIARERYRALAGMTVPFEHCTVFGDTPHDVECSRVHGGRAVAVATGRHTSKELVDSGADLVLHDLSDVESALAFLTGDPAL